MACAGNSCGEQHVPLADDPTRAVAFFRAQSPTTLLKVNGCPLVDLLTGIGGEELIPSCIRLLCLATT